MQTQDRIRRTPPLTVDVDAEMLESGAMTPERRNSRVPGGDARMGTAVVDEEYKQVMFGL